MCRIYATQDPCSYESVTRSVRLNGYATSIRLETEFWIIVDEIAASEGVSTARFVSTLYDEVLDHVGEVRNFASLLRVACIRYLHRSPVPGFEAEAGRKNQPVTA
jgi:predicted DNA-binding ribbon-helix-helix protein